MSIGERLRVLRYNAKISMRQQGKLFGVSANSVYRWEHNLNIPSLPVLKKISEYYNVPLEWLVGESKVDKVAVALEQNSGCSAEQQFINIYRELPESAKKKAFEYIERLYEDVINKEHAKEKKDAGKVQEKISIVKGALRLNLFSGQAFVNGKDILLKPKEFNLLLLFAQHESETISTEYIYEKVWGQPMNEDSGAVRFQISNLREKLPGSGYTITSQRGEGYIFEKPAEQ